MEITPQDQKTILRFVKRGVAASSSKLAAISRTVWDIRGISLEACARPEDCAQLKEPSESYLGAYCQAPGKLFLAFFSELSAARSTLPLMSGGAGGRLSTPQRREAAVAEVANIVINAVADALAEPGGVAVILSAPKCVRGQRADIIKAAFGNLFPSGRIFSVFIHMASQEIAADCTLLMMLDDVNVNFLLQHPEA